MDSQNITGSLLDHYWIITGSLDGIIIIGDVEKAMKKLSKIELVAILATVGVSAGSCAIAADLDSSSTALGKVEHQSATKLGADSKCGKGSCGTDEKGAAAAQEKRAKKKEERKAARKDAKKKEAADAPKEPAGK